MPQRFNGMVATGSNISSSANSAPPELEQPKTRDQQEATRRAKPAWLRFLQRLFVYFSIYVFSLGPMYWHWWEGKYLYGSKLIAAFYEPLYLLTKWIPPLGWFVNSYVHIWVFELKWTI